MDNTNSTSRNNLGQGSAAGMLKRHRSKSASSEESQSGRKARKINRGEGDNTEDVTGKHQVSLFKGASHTTISNSRMLAVGGDYYTSDPETMKALKN
ncbi:hypothetical protein VKT23_012074 [Stygiomarasmius scandens]|uniref:Uncharacterized protein n=1 Tax=Marasmiellus scandens TaxID=2682957 RepID=A0ABR1JAW4_9AGAR